jgi:hypothetical protein
VSKPSLPWAWVRRRLLGISPEEASFARRGFGPAEPAVQTRLEEIGRVFVRGYLAGLEGAAASLRSRLEVAEPEFRGFAYEGAAMALALLDELTPWRRDRLGWFLSGIGSPHVYMGYVGAGWAYARLRRRVVHVLPRLDPLLGWLVVDGFGFHEGYFNSSACVRGRARPRQLSGYARQVFDQGLGRSLWFVEGADPARITRTVRAFESERHPDLWSGVGLAATYAGGAERAALGALVLAAGPYRSHLAQGAAFAAEARRRAGIPTRHTDLGCQVLAETSAAVAAAVTASALSDLDVDGSAPPYRAWRSRIRAHFEKEGLQC